MRGVIFDIQGYALHDGPGIRTCVFLKGCPLRCAWCHNPEAQQRAPETARDGAGNVERIGWHASVDEVVERVLRDEPFLRASGGGVTLTGGEPTAQPDFACALLDAFRDAGLHTAIETCGLFPPALVDRLLPRVDLFLFDLKQVDAAAHRQGTGAGNERILENLAELLLRAGHERVLPRIPLIPGFNDGERDLHALAALLADLDYRGPVHLMPYHGWARDKYARLGREAARFDAADDPKLSERATTILHGEGLEAVWGGAA